MADPASWDLLDEDCSSFASPPVVWGDSDYANSESTEVTFDNKSCFKFNGNTAANPNYSLRNTDFGNTPNVFTVELAWYHNTLGTISNSDHVSWTVGHGGERLRVRHGTDGLIITDTDLGDIGVGTNLVKFGGSAEWQIWRILVTFTTTPGEGVCDIYLYDSTHNWELVGDGIACSHEGSGGSYDSGVIYLSNSGYTINDMISHIDYIKIVTGLYAPRYCYFSGYTFEQNNPVSRKLYLHNRTTGELITTTTSSGNGYYYLETTSSGSHYIVCLDDEAGEEYNDLIIGSAIPTEIT